MQTLPRLPRFRHHLLRRHRRLQLILRHQRVIPKVKVAKVIKAKVRREKVKARV